MNDETVDKIVSDYGWMLMEMREKVRARDDEIRKLKRELDSAEYQKELYKSRYEELTREPEEDEDKEEEE